MGAETTKKLLEEARRNAVDDLLVSIGTSMASFIAEIDSDSTRVADYLACRLAPLKGLALTDIRVREALDQIARDARKG